VLAAVGGEALSHVDAVLEAALLVAADEALVGAGVDQFAGRGGL
jgi:hypothetical protein